MPANVRAGGPPPIAVVGAGYAGMAAAVSLAGAGVPVTVFEAGPVPGGRARRVSVRGHSLDNGQHVLIGAYRELLRLMRRVGVPDDALLRLPLELRYVDGFALRARPLPGSWGLLAGLLGARPVGLRERLDALRFMRALRNAGFRLETDVTVEALLRAHRQNGPIGRYVWRALCVSALNTPPEQASARVFVNVLRDTLAGGPGASDLLLPRVDLSRLFPEPAAEYLSARGGALRCGAAVRDLAALREEFACVVLAVGPHQLAPFAAQLGTLPAWSFQPIVTCYLQYDAGVALPRPMLGFAEGHVQWVFDRGRLLGERGRLACVISAEGAHRALEPDALAAACHAELAAALPGLGAPLWSQVIVEKRATIACTPGVPRPGPQTQTPGVFLAGDYTESDYPPTLEAAVRSGVRAAQRALAAVRGRID